MIMGIPETIEAWDTKYTPDWRFDTARYSIVFYADEEDMSPHDGYFSDDRDVERACSGNLHDWFCAVVAIYGEDGKLLAWDTLGGCSYRSIREFYASHRWQYSRRQHKWITDPKSRAWKACEARRPRRDDGSRAEGSYFTGMVHEVVNKARKQIALASEGARRA